MIVHLLQNSTSVLITFNENWNLPNRNIWSVKYFWITREFILRNYMNIIIINLFPVEEVYTQCTYSLNKN